MARAKRTPDQPPSKRSKSSSAPGPLPPPLPLPLPDISNLKLYPVAPIPEPTQPAPAAAVQPAPTSAFLSPISYNRFLGRAWEVDIPTRIYRHPQRREIMIATVRRRFAGESHADIANRFSITTDAGAPDVSAVRKLEDVLRWMMRDIAQEIPQAQPVPVLTAPALTQEDVQFRREVLPETMNAAIAQNKQDSVALLNDTLAVGDELLREPRAIRDEIASELRWAASASKQTFQSAAERTQAISANDPTRVPDPDHGMMLGSIDRVMEAVKNLGDVFGVYDENRERAAAEHARPTQPQAPGAQLQVFLMPKLSPEEAERAVQVQMGRSSSLAVIESTPL